MYILALEMASPENQHCANCIGTFRFPYINLAIVDRLPDSAPGPVLPPGGSV